MSLFWDSLNSALFFSIKNHPSLNPRVSHPLLRNSKTEYITQSHFLQLESHLAGLSEDLLESYGNSWGFADEGVLSYLIKLKLLKILADIHNEIISFQNIGNDKNSISKNLIVPPSSSIWTSDLQSGVGSGI